MNQTNLPFRDERVITPSGDGTVLGTVSVAPGPVYHVVVQLDMVELGDLDVWPPGYLERIQPASTVAAMSHL